MANKRQRKKNEKKAQISKLSQSMLTPIRRPSPALYHGKYTEANKGYQAQLDQVYQGTVQPVERFINLNANILHYCSECDSEFYAAGKYLLNPHKEHVCYTINGAGSNKHKVVKKSIKPDEFIGRFNFMVWNDYSWRKIAQELGINPKIVKSYFEEEGLL
ncbi:hypothetical protein GKZ89_08855 [Bacillus mangrovi]|uniref:Uncharacterized protein n=1 Tax=Metabacillus mangrovi TaxID=1491830 RepID=A0A7X2S672_9BACI|nr:hypothetical protein [Metabacillus mangrovi]MTH53526.1 hypothetical protein [Metabacillus mangrovi]